jgi:superfamily II DNA helicase RecQ
MAFRLFTIPFDEGRELFDEDALNQFCQSRQLRHWKAEFFQLGGRAYWSILLEVEALSPAERRPPDTIKGQKPDKQTLALLEALKEWRRDLVDKEGVPAYVIATNRELDEIALLKPHSLEGLKSIRGMGKKKIDRHGSNLLEIVKRFKGPS